MITTIDILEKIRELNRWSDYRAAKELGISPNTVSSWRRRGSVMNDEIGVKAAEILGLEEKFILMCLQAERTVGSPVFQYLQEVVDDIEVEEGGLETAKQYLLC